MPKDSSEFTPLPRGKPKRKPRKPRAVGSDIPSAPRRTASRSRAAVAATEDAAPKLHTGKKKRAARKNPFGFLKYVAFILIVGVGVFALMNLQPAPPPLPPDFTPDPNATLVPTRASILPIINFPTFPTAAPTFTPTPIILQVAIVAGHWAQEANDGVPTVHDSGAVCPDGLREVDITKSVADKTLDILKRRGYHTVLLQEFDPIYEAEPKFAPKSFLSIHADSCLTGAEYSFATGYKIAHAEPSNNETQDARLVTCLTRSYDKVAEKYDKPFNANTITRDMTEYHAFRKIDPTTPAAIIELGFLGFDRDFLVNHQDEMAQGLAKGIDDFLKGNACVPATATPAPTETTLP